MQVLYFIVKLDLEKYLPKSNYMLWNSNGRFDGRFEFARAQLINHDTKYSIGYIHFQMHSFFGSGREIT